jgi:hypothetical protein
MGSQGGATDVMGGETELLLRLAAAGERALFVPSAGVVHVIEPHQMTAAWLACRAFRQGRTFARLRPDGVGRILGAPARLWGMLAVRYVRRMAAARRGERARLETAMKILHARGQLYERMRARPAAERFAGFLLP